MHSGATQVVSTSDTGLVQSLFRLIEVMTLQIKSAQERAKAKREALTEDDDEDEDSGTDTDSDGDRGSSSSASSNGLRHQRAAKDIFGDIIPKVCFLFFTMEIKGGCIQGLYEGFVLLV